MVQNQFVVNLKGFRPDNIREYFNQILSPYFQSHSIIHDLSYINILKQNEVVEMKNGHLTHTTWGITFSKVCFEVLFERYCSYCHVHDKETFLTCVR